MTLIACIDVGSTFTKGLLVDSAGTMLAAADHRTTSDTDVLIGLDAVVAALESAAGAVADEVRVSSSAGGGLRLAVVGHERAISAQAGFRVGLSAGSRVVHVAAGMLDSARVSELKQSRPDIVLLVGGTDGGNEQVIRHNAAVLAKRGPRVPYVVAGNVEARADIVALLEEGGRTAMPADNVIPRIGVLDPGSAREAIRSLFVSHVIGGKGLSRGTRFASMVSGATPDIVMRAVELLADGTDSFPGVGDVMVVDVGGATTDVYSVVSPDPAAEHEETDDVVGQWHAARTVEGDLGMRWSAVGVVDAAELERLAFVDGDLDATRVEAQRCHDDVGMVPLSDSELSVDEWLATTAVTVAARRHARPVELPGGTRTTARDLRRVALIIGSGGVLRHSGDTTRERVLAPLTTDGGGGWMLPGSVARSVVDEYAVLAAAGLLAPDHPDAANSLMAAQLLA
ncbi:MAG: glutamate mutase L [Actinobacteria bacterium]|nr:glutamate mutase L [Actinomycetota bacterium]